MFQTRVTHISKHNDARTRCFIARTRTIGFTTPSTTKIVRNVAFTTLPTIVLLGQLVLQEFRTWLLLEQVDVATLCVGSDVKPRVLATLFLNMPLAKFVRPFRLFYNASANNLLVHVVKPWVLQQFETHAAKTQGRTTFPNTMVLTNTRWQHIWVWKWCETNSCSNAFLGTAMCHIL